SRESVGCGASILGTPHVLIQQTVDSGRGSLSLHELLVGPVPTALVEQAADVRKCKQGVRMTGKPTAVHLLFKEPECLTGVHPRTRSRPGNAIIEWRAAPHASHSPRPP